MLFKQDPLNLDQTLMKRIPAMTAGILLTFYEERLSVQAECRCATFFNSFLMAFKRSISS